MTDDWAKARMWSWKQLEGWGNKTDDGKQKTMGLVERLEYAEKLTQWVMCGPHPAAPAPDADLAPEPGGETT